MWCVPCSAADADRVEAFPASPTMLLVDMRVILHREGVWLSQRESNPCACMGASQGLCVCTCDSASSCIQVSPRSGRNQTNDARSSCRCSCPALVQSERSGNIRWSRAVNDTKLACMSTSQLSLRRNKPNISRPPMANNPWPGCMQPLFCTACKASCASSR